jgi:exodeoxyribonuclease VII large subunit
MAATPLGESVHGLIERIRSLLKSGLGGDLILHGIVSGYHGAGYLDLQDETDGRLSVSVSFYGRPQVFEPLVAAGFPMQDGLPVMIRGYATLSNQRSQIRFMVTGVVPQYTRSVLKSRRDETNERLRKEGVFDAQEHVRFPLLPRVLGIVTSERGVVFDDVRKALSAARFVFRYTWARSAVQGTEGVREMTNAVRGLGEDPRVDVICLFRGGGSALELDAFNAYELARAICDCRKPVLVAVGHHNDECSAQDVAFRNCHTPSLLGEFLAGRIEGLRQRLTAWSEIASRRLRERHHGTQKDVQLVAGRCRALLSAAVEGRQRDIGRLGELSRVRCGLQVRAARRRTIETARPVPARVRAALKRARNEIARSRGWLPRAMSLLQNAHSRCETLVARLGAVDPVRQLRRGFALVRRADGKILTTVGELDRVPAALLQMQDGIRRVVVRENQPRAGT